MSTLNRRIVRSPEPIPRLISPTRIVSSPNQSLPFNYNKIFHPRLSYTPNPARRLNQIHNQNPSQHPTQTQNTHSLQYYQNVATNSLSPVKNSINNLQNISGKGGQGHTPPDKTNIPSEIKNIRVIESIEVNKKHSPSRLEQSPIISESTVMNHNSPSPMKYSRDLKHRSVSRQLNPERTDLSLSAHDQYILQLLNESKEMKVIVERLIEDNMKLVQQNNKHRLIASNEEELIELRKLVRHYQEEIRELKEQRNFRVEKVGTIQDDSELEHCNRIISALEKEVTNSKIGKQGRENAISIVSLDDYQKLQAELKVQNTEITILKQQNIDLANKLRQLLTEMHLVELKFQNQKLELIQQNNQYKSYAQEEIRRLRGLPGEEGKQSKGYQYIFEQGREIDINRILNQQSVPTYAELTRQVFKVVKNANAKISDIDQETNNPI